MRKVSQFDLMLDSKIQGLGLAPDLPIVEESAEFRALICYGNKTSLARF
jgi:hypothetical protein